MYYDNDSGMIKRGVQETVTNDVIYWGVGKESYGSAWLTLIYDDNVNDEDIAVPEQFQTEYSSTIYSAALSTDIPERNGYIFKGWSTISGANNPVHYDTVNESGVEITMTYLNPEITLYAVWASAIGQEATPAVGIDYTDETLAGFGDGDGDNTDDAGSYQVTVTYKDEEGTEQTTTFTVTVGAYGTITAVTNVTGDDDVTISTDRTGINIPDQWIDADNKEEASVSVVKEGDGSTTTDSDAQVFDIPQRPVVDVDPANCSAINADDGTLTNNDTTYAVEYRSSESSDESGWTEITADDTATGLATGDYNVYVPATATSFKSDEVTKTISVGTYTVTYMNITSDTDYTFTTYQEVTVNSGATIETLPTEPTLTDSDYSFGGWVMAVDDGAGGYTTEAITADTVCTSDITAYATWKMVNVNVNVNVDVSTDGSESAQILAEMTAIETFNNTQSNPSDNLQWYTIDLTADVITISIDSSGDVTTVVAEEPVYEITGPAGYLAPIGVLIDFDMEDKENLKLYRYHDESNSTAEVNPGDTVVAASSGNVTLFDEVYERQTATYENFYNFPIYGFSAASVYFSDEDLSNADTETEGNVGIYSGKFSTFAIGYDDVSTSSSGGTSYYTSILADTTNGSATLSSTRNALNATVTVDTNPDDGYEVASVVVTYGSGRTVSVTDNGDGTYSYKQPGATATVTVTFIGEGVEEDTGDGASLNRDDHFAYMLGYTDGTFGPTRNITRAEATVMFSHLLTNTIPEDLEEIGFVDMTGDEWYADAVAIMTHYGIITGYSDGTFGGNQSITRAQFAAIASRFDELAKTDVNIFSDVPDDYWAISYINSAVEKGWIYGYADGTFQPNAYITRAAAVTMVNRVLERSADLDFVQEHLDELRTFTDVDATYWAYGAIIEAANGHEYKRNDDDSETWTDLT